MSFIKVLIADDHERTRRAILSVIESDAAYCVCDEARDGIDALDKVRRLRPDIVLMDINMPRMDGFQATRAIRKLRPPVSAIPIVAVTANALAGEREKCLAAGMDDYVPKPVSKEALDQALARWLPVVEQQAPQVIAPESVPA